MEQHNSLLVYLHTNNYYCCTVLSRMLESN